MTARTERQPTASAAGLASLIPQPSRGGDRRARDPARPDPPNPLSAAPPRRRAGASDARREHPRARRPPAGPRHARPLDGYQLVAGERRVRAAETGRAGAHPGRRPPARRPGPARAGARREPPARRPRPDRGSPRVPPADRRVRVDARRSVARRVGRARRPSPTRCACSSSTRTSRLPSSTAASARATPARSAGLAREQQATVLRTVIEQRALGPPDRGARPPPPRAAGPDEPLLGHASRHDPDLERVEEDLRRALGTKVSLGRSRKGGRIVIEYYSDEELGRLYERLTGGNCVTEAHRAEQPATDDGRGKRARRAAGDDYDGRQHPGPRGPRGRPQASRHVHRLDRRHAGCITSSGRSSTTRSTRRWPATRRRSSSRSARTARSCVAGRRPRHPGRQALDRQGRPRGRPHRAPRRRQVRRRRLQGLGRPPRRRRLRRQRALRVAARRGLRATARSGQEYARASPRRPVNADRPTGRRGRGTLTRFRADPEIFETHRVLVRHDRPAAARVGVPHQGRLDHARDERVDRERSFYFEGGLVSFVRHLNRNKEVLHTRPIYVRASATARRPSRSRSSTTTRSPRTSASRTTSTPSTAARTSPASGGADALAQRLGASATVSSRTPTATSPATTSARA